MMPEADAIMVFPIADVCKQLKGRRLYGEEIWALKQPSV